ncbi:MAG: hypothetical protein HYY76_14255 [Acidobacteria bacterium]|nr:hypothetical protein [Acidobacteriota bacterium]
MRFPQRVAAVTLLVISCAVTARAGQTPAAPAPVVLTPAQMEEFLLNAKVIRMRSAGDGITNSRRATLSEGALTHDAHIQVIDQSRILFEAGKYSEVNFKDTYRYNIAAYRLARLLELDNVPMSVERPVDGRPAAVTWWIDDVMMDEGDRRKKGARDPNPGRANGYVYRYRVFDELIQNRDRNLGNLLYTSDWKMWMIDHTRAFRLGRALLNPRQLVRIERSLFENLKALTAESVAAAVGKSLIKEEINAVIIRRDAIVTLFEAEIAKRGGEAVLYTMPE